MSVHSSEVLEVWTEADASMVLDDEQQLAIELQMRAIEDLTYFQLYAIMQEGMTERGMAAAILIGLRTPQAELRRCA